MADQPEEREAVSERDLPLNALVAETLPTEHSHLWADPEVQWHAGDLGSGLTSTAVHAEREVNEVEMWPKALESEPGDLRGPDPSQKHNSQGKVSLLPVPFSHHTLYVKCLDSTVCCFKVPLQPCREGTHANGGDRHRTGVCDRERADNA